MTMTWEEKLMALKALSGEATLRIREPGNWYCSLPRVSIKEGSFLTSPTSSSATPQDAVEDMWRRCVTELPDNQCIVIGAYIGQRQEVRWNGFMWAAFS